MSHPPGGRLGRTSHIHWRLGRQTGGETVLSTEGETAEEEEAVDVTFAERMDIMRETVRRRRRAGALAGALAGAQAGALAGALGGRESREGVMSAESMVTLQETARLRNM